MIIDALLVSTCLLLFFFFSLLRDEIASGVIIPPQGGLVALNRGAGRTGLKIDHSNIIYPSRTWLMAATWAAVSGECDDCLRSRAKPFSSALQTNP